jgi:hypothetical protein
LKSIKNERLQKRYRIGLLDFIVLTGDADLRFLALQPRSAMGGWDMNINVGKFLKYELKKTLFSHYSVS